MMTESEETFDETWEQLKAAQHWRESRMMCEYIEKCFIEDFKQHSSIWIIREALVNIYWYIHANIQAVMIMVNSLHILSGAALDGWNLQQCVGGFQHGHQRSDGVAATAH
jgi:hypothetical protein